MSKNQDQKQNNNGKTSEQELADAPPAAVGQLFGGTAAPVTLEELPPEGGEPPAATGTGKRSDDQRRLMTALARAQGEVKNAKKNQTNTHFKTDYADLAAIADACRGALSKNLIAWVQIPHFSDGGEIWLETTLTHGPSGQYRTGDYPIPKSAIGKSQDLVAAFTYARRASLAMMVGVVAEGEDDDGNTAADGERDQGQQQANNEPAKLTKAQAAALQWGDGALRKIPSFESIEKLTTWETERQEALSDLLRIMPSKHAEVEAALKAQAAKLTPGQSEDLGPHA